MVEQARLEARIVCPTCNVTRFRLYSTPAQGNGSGIRANRLEPTPIGNDHKQCFRCGTALERREA